jgi:hypothetical protein
MSSARLVRFHDAALEPALFRHVLRSVRAVGAERLATTYQTTFWFDLRQRPTALVEVAALELARLALTAADRRKVRGVEWWLSRMRTTDVRVDFHRDHDIHREKRTGRQVHPRVSSVLFLNRARGGLLAVTRDAPNPDNASCSPDRLDRLELVRPLPNRFAAFSGALTHGVLDHRNQVPEDGDPKRPGPGPLRLAVILNWWPARPEGIRRFSDARVYPALRLRGMYPTSG